MRRLAAALAVLAAAGCSALRPVPRRPPPGVVEIQPSQAARCTRLGSVEATHANGETIAENDGFALDDARAQVATRGGNAYVITRRSAAVWRSTVVLEAYRCPSWEPVPGLEPR